MIIKSKYTEAVFHLKEEAIELASSFSLFKDNVKNWIELNSEIELRSKKKKELKKELSIFITENKNDFLWSNLVILKTKERQTKDKEGIKLISNNKTESKKELLGVYNLTRILKTEIKELKHDLQKISNTKENENFFLLKEKNDLWFSQQKTLEQNRKLLVSKENELFYQNKIDLQIKNLQISIVGNKVKITFDKLPYFNEYELYYFENNEFYKLFDFEYQNEIYFDSNKKIFSIIPKGVLNG